MSSLTSIMLVHLTQDVETGIGTIKSVLPALKVGSSTLKMFVPQSVTNVKNMTQLVSVLHATKDMIWLTELVSSLHSITPSPQTLDAVNGIGTTKYVWNALTDGTSTQRKYVFPLMTSAHHMTVPQVIVPHVSQVISFQTEFVNLPTLFVNHQPNQELAPHAILDTS